MWNAALCPILIVCDKREGYFVRADFTASSNVSAKKVLAGFRFDSYELVHMLGFEFALQLSRIEVLGTIDNRSCFR